MRIIRVYDDRTGFFHVFWRKFIGDVVEKNDQSFEYCTVNNGEKVRAIWTRDEGKFIQKNGWDFSEEDEYVVYWDIEWGKLPNRTDDDVKALGADNILKVVVYSSIDPEDTEERDKLKKLLGDEHEKIQEDIIRIEYNNKNGNINTFKNELQDNQQTER